MDLAANGVIEPSAVDQCPSPHLPSKSPSLPSRTDIQGVGKLPLPLKVRGRGLLTRVVDKLLARGEHPDTAASAPDPPWPPVHHNPVAVLPAPVLHKLQKLGTSVEVEVNLPTPTPATNANPAFVPTTVPPPLPPTPPPPLPSGYQQLMDSLDKAVGLTSDLTRPKKRAHKKSDQVPCTAQLLAEIDSCDSLAKFSFRVDAKQVIELPEGQKLYTCDICSGVYYRGFSLKRHYLKTHINYKHIHRRDLHNCGILLDPSIEKGGSRKKLKDEAPEVVTNLAPPSDIPDLYRCHTCMQCFRTIPELQAHLIEHPPSSINSPEVYTCPKCETKYHKKKNYQRHREECGVTKTLAPSQIPPQAPLQAPLQPPPQNHLTAAPATVVPAPESYSCSDCGAKFDKKKSFLRHRDECSLDKNKKAASEPSDRPPVSSKPPKSHPCTTCGENFQKKKLLLRHQPQCSDKKPLESPKLLVKKSTLVVRPTYTCNTCGVKYRKKKPFIRHRDHCVAKSGKPAVPLLCLYCDSTFPSFLLRQQHNLHQHHPKKKLLQCYLCNTKMFRDRLAVLKHLVLHHPEEYYGCLACRVRFSTREELKKHNKENHRPLLPPKPKDEGDDPAENGYDGVPGDPALVMKCTECPKVFASKLNMTRHRRIAHRHVLVIDKSKGWQKKLEAQTVAGMKQEKDAGKSPSPPPASAPAPQPDSPVPDPEVLFYSTVAHNIRENLTHHLDGKLDSQEVMEYDLNKTAPSRIKVLNFSASFSADSLPTTSNAGTNSSGDKENMNSATVGAELRERVTPISPRGQFEKFSFPKNYDGRCGLTSYIRDMSHLDIATQLTMRRNLQQVKGGGTTGVGEGSSEAPGDIPSGLLLRERPVDCAESFGPPSTGDSPVKDAADVGGVLSGEWVRPRTFVCSACGFRSPSLWTVEDHKYELHPNVWVPHVEIVGDHSASWDWFYHKRLPPSTVIPAAASADTAAEAQTPLCSKCAKTSASVPDLHRHMLECGGDVGWVGVAARRRRGKRRHRGQGRRGMKRNIPNTPAKHVCGRIRTKPGDMDTIQKMIANLPAKRASRRVLGDEPDIKTRSQATITSVPISSLPAHSSAARAAGLKSKPARSKLHCHKRLMEGQVRVKQEPGTDEVELALPRPMEAEHTVQHEDILASLEVIPVVRPEPKPVEMKQEPVQVLEVKAEVHAVNEPAEGEADGPIDTNLILAAMREAMMMSDGPAVKQQVGSSAKNSSKTNTLVKTELISPAKPAEKKRRSRKSEKGNKSEVVVKKEVKKEPDLNDIIVDGDVIICNGCGMQFDNASACHRHKKKCVYWKEEKINKCAQCGCIFPYLMALLQHDCSRDDPAMPQLEPVGEGPTSDPADDLPILSPAGDSSVRRMALLETTIREVSDNSFDTLQYYDKLFADKKSVEIVMKKEPVDKPAKKRDSISNKGILNKSVHKVADTAAAKTPGDKSLAKESSDKPTNKVVNGISKESGNKPKQDSVEKPAKKEVSERVKKEPLLGAIKKESADKAVDISEIAGVQGLQNSVVRESNKNLPKRRSSQLLKDSTSRTSSKSPVKRECVNNSDVKDTDNITKLKIWSEKSVNSKTKTISPESQRKNSSIKPSTSRTRSKSPVKVEYLHDGAGNETNENTSVKNSLAVKTLPSNIKCKSPENNIRKLKVTDIFKQVKKAPKKRRKKKAVIVRKVLPSRVVHRTSPSKTEVSPKKRAFNKRPRSSNFVMLMKELEKLEKEGAVAVGKRKRFSDPGPIEEFTRTTRRRSGAQPLSFDLESMTSNTSSVLQDQLILMPRKRRRQANSMTTDSATSETPKDNQSKVTLVENDIVQKSISSQEATSKKRKIKNEDGIHSSVDDLVQNVGGDVPVIRRRPGRPRAKSATSEIVGHINETIETVLNIFNENTKESVLKGEVNHLPLNKSITKQDGKPNADMALNNDQEHKSLKLNFGDIPEHQVSSGKEVDKADEIIYKVSIGSPEIFNSDFSFSVLSSTPNSVNKRVRSKKAIKTSPLESKLHTGEIATQLTIPDILQVTEAGEKCDIDLQKGEKRKILHTDEETTLNVKSKEIRTKQLSIADYLSISHFIKKSADTPSSSSLNISLESNTKKSSPISDLRKEIENGTEVSVSMSVPTISEVTNHNSSQTSEECGTVEKQISRNQLKRKDIKQNQADLKQYILEKPSSPSSTSSKDDVSLSVIREKVIKKKKNRKIKLKKLLKNKSLEQLDIVSNKTTKLTKLKVPFKVDKMAPKEKLLKKKKVSVGVSRNRWEVSVVESQKPVEMKVEEENSVPPPNEPVRIFYCAICDLKFESSFLLYQHQMTNEHKAKQRVENASQAGGSREDADPVKYCKSIGNIINDLEKRTLNVAKVMHQLKHQPEAPPAPAAAGIGHSPCVEAAGAVMAAAAVPVAEERWEGHNTPPWDDTASLGSIMDTVNRLLDQETPPGYSWADLQLAMGASDEEMAMLEQLGETTLQEEYNNVYNYNTMPEEPPSLIDLDQPEVVPSPTPSNNSTVAHHHKGHVGSAAAGSGPGPAHAQSADHPREPRKTEPVDTDMVESKVCRSLVRPRHILGEYEAREMVCPTCNKHFFGLAALENHLACAHSALPPNQNRLMQSKRTSLLAAEEADRRRICFICQEMVASPSLLEAHIRESHAKEVSQDSTTISETAEKLKSKMSLALGGLVDRALNKILGGRPTASPTPTPSPSSSPAHFATPPNVVQPDFNSGALQLLGRLCAVKKRGGNDNMRLSPDTLQLLGRLRSLSQRDAATGGGRPHSSQLAHEVRQALARARPPAVSKTALTASVTSATAGGTELKPTNLLDHLAVCSADVTQRPYACPICDLRFLIPSTRNRHIARAHGKYGHRYDTDEDNSNQELDYGWKEAIDPGLDANDETQILPLCSDCGLSFQSIHDVIQHRIEDHPRRFSAEERDDKSGLTADKHSVVESSSERASAPPTTEADDLRLLPVSDNAIDSTSTAKKKKAVKPEPKSDHGAKAAKSGGKGRKRRRAVESEESQTSQTTEEGEESELLCGEKSTLDVEKSSNGNSSEENLAELSKKLDRRKVRTGNLGEAAVREKAEAALRELSRKKASVSPGAKWGATAMRFTPPPQPPLGGRARFAGLAARWRPDLAPRTELIDVKPDIYDFRDDESDPRRSPWLAPSPSPLASARPSPGDGS